MKRRSGNMKEKYIIRVYLSSFYDVEVEAENVQDAKQQAESSENWDMVEYPAVTVRTIGVEWDTDGMDEEELDLPSEVEIPGELDDEDVTDWLSDHYGFCLKSWYEI